MWDADELGYLVASGWSMSQHVENKNAAEIDAVLQRAEIAKPRRLCGAILHGDRHDAVNEMERENGDVSICEVKL